MKYTRKTRTAEYDAHHFGMEPLPDWAACDVGIELLEDGTALLESEEMIVVKKGDWIIRNDDGELFQRTDKLFKDSFQPKN